MHFGLSCKNFCFISNIMWIWFGMSLLSMIIGVFLFPNQNLDQKRPKLAQGDSLASKLYFRSFKLKTNTVTSQFHESLLYLKSPIFWVHLLMFSVGNCTVGLGFVLI